MPIRYQHRRVKGFRGPARCKVVMRPSKYGNPFKPDRLGDPAA